MELFDLISVDLGKTTAIACWRKERCVEVQCFLFEGAFITEDLSFVFNRLNDLISSNRPSVAVERPARTMPHQWILFSDLRSLAENYMIGFKGYMPQEIKKTVTDNGRADKDAMRKAVVEASVYDGGDVRNLNEHEIDAVACGICHIRRVMVL